MYVIAYYDAEGKRREPETWDEVKRMICNRWDSCSPCPHRGGHSMTHGGFACHHPLVHLANGGNDGTD